MTAPLKITHYVSLSGFGGVEQQFSQFFHFANTLPDYDQSVIVCSRDVHAHHRETLALANTALHEKHWHGLRVPHMVRSRYYAYIASRARPDVALLWNRMGQQARVLDTLGPDKCLYWEHGSAWLHGEDEAKRYAAQHLEAMLCNSKAALKILRQRWDYQGPVDVCLNGLRPSARAASPQPKSYPTERPLRIGVAARLLPRKGVFLALYTLDIVRRAGMEATLHIAGAGPDLARLQALATTLNIGEQVHFHGVVQDMIGFYGFIDLLLHAAVHEPFGVVCIEAGANGVPVLCTEVDGLPEAVEHDSTGLCVRPETPVEQIYEFDGHSYGDPHRSGDETLPPVVYHPADDCVGPARFARPVQYADAIFRMANDHALFGRMSHTAIEQVPQRFDFEAHVHEVLRHVRRFSEQQT